MKKIDFIFPIVATAVVFTVILLSNRIPKRDMFLQDTATSQERAVYYWRTTFSLNDYEAGFLKKYRIGKMYVRFFDVDMNHNPKFNDVCAPLASVDFYEYALDTVRNYGIEIVPVVFITPEAIIAYPSFTDHLARRLYAMCFKNGISIYEVQFDCDWTTSTKDSYFQFLTEIRQMLYNYFDDSLKISSTIRLHQLMQDPPEVDYGVLMCYNTGDFKAYETENSILDVKDVKPYLPYYLKNYRLPLVLALPAYSWCVEFDQNKEFIRLNKTNCSVTDTAKYRRLSDGRYEVITPLPEDNTRYVRYEKVSVETILKTKEMIERYRAGMPVVLFHLDNEQLSNYSDNEIKAFFE